MGTSHSSPTMACLAGLATALLVLAAGLPARTFFVGDSGVKLIVARNAIGHPRHPFNVDLPRIGANPVSLLDPFFYVHQDHAHAATSDIFAVMSAPFIDRLGIRGAYVLPAIGFLLAMAGITWLGMELDRRRSPILLMFVVAVSTPLLFYALEFWEHAPAIGLSALATALIVRQRRSITRFLVSGGLFGASVLLRPEAVWYALSAAALATCALSRRLTLSEGVMLAVGIVIGASPLFLIPLIHSGNLLGVHLTSNLSDLHVAWFHNRLILGRTWFVPDRLALGLLVLLVVSAIGVGLAGSDTSARTRQTTFVVLAGALSVAAALKAFPRESLANAAPLAALILTSPIESQRRGGRLFLLGTSALCSVLVVFTAPNDGGGQWGPRYLLFGFIPAAVLIADALDMTWRSLRTVGRGAVSVMLIAASLVQLRGYMQLRNAKRAYAQLTDALERDSMPGSYVITDLWWLDQVTASLYPTRTILFVDSATTARSTLQQLFYGVGIPNLVLVNSRTESLAGPISSWISGTGLTIAATDNLSVRSLTIHVLR